MSSSSSSLAEQDSLTALQLAELERDVEAQPLVGAVTPAAVLRAHFAGNAAFAGKLASCEAAFAAFRPVRSDGHCFLRAVLLRLGELSVEAGVRAPPAAAAPAAFAAAAAAPAAAAAAPAAAAPAAAAPAAAEALAAASPLQAHYAALVERAAGAGDLLVNAFGYEPATTSDFLEEGMCAFLRSLGGGPPEPYAHLGGLDKMRSFYTLFSLRLLASLEVRKSEDEYIPFILGTTDCATAAEFCAETERSANPDVDMVQVMAVAAALQVRLEIGYLDAGAGAAGGAMSVIRIPEGEAAARLPPGAPTLQLLYRPGSVTARGRVCVAPLAAHARSQNSSTSPHCSPLEDTLTWPTRTAAFPPSAATPRPWRRPQQPPRRENSAPQGHAGAGSAAPCTKAYPSRSRSASASSRAKASTAATSSAAKLSGVHDSTSTRPMTTPSRIMGAHTSERTRPSHT